MSTQDIIDLDVDEDFRMTLSEWSFCLHGTRYSVTVCPDGQSLVFPLEICRALSPAESSVGFDQQLFIQDMEPEALGVTGEVPDLYQAEHSRQEFVWWNQQSRVDSYENSWSGLPSDFVWNYRSQLDEREDCSVVGGSFPIF